MTEEPTARSREVIRRPRPEDAPCLAQVHIMAWQEAYREDFSEEFLSDLDVDRRTDWFRRRIAVGEGLLVAEVDSRIVGFCFFGESSTSGWAEVFAVYVDPDEWGLGHGRGLLTAAETALAGSGYDRALLWVLESNQRARDFYERQGWSLGRPVKLEEIGGRQVTEVRYERSLGSFGARDPDPPDM